MWQYKEEFSPFFISWSLAKHKEGEQGQNPVPIVIHLCCRGQLVYHQSWICFESGTLLQLSQKPLTSCLPSYSYLFIDSFKQQVFIENCAVGRYSILWRYVGGQGKQGPCSWGSYIRQETETKTTEQTNEQYSIREKCHEENTAAKREGLMVIKGMYHLGEDLGKRL